LRSRRGIGLSLAALAAAGALAACGSNTPTSAYKPPGVTSAGPGGQPASGTVVGLRGGLFVPPHLTQLVGHVIHFENFDPVPRQIVATSGAHFRSRVLQAGQVFDYAPTHAGTIHVQDALHPSVKGVITVEKP
jgi:hypothetical protein